jgi:poly(3-hydroxybutyrate) depolymerase
VFAAGGIHSGLEYAAAESSAGAVTAMASGGPNPIEQGTDAYQLMNTNGVVSRIPTIVFHGTDDAAIDPVNAHQATTQAIRTNDLANGNIDTDPDVVRNGTAEVFDYTMYEYHDQNGSVVEKWIVNEMGHAWSGGSAGGEYTAPGGPDASRILWEFFASHPDAGNNGGFEKFCGTDYNYQHEDAGRAVYQGGYYATGSGDYLGLSSYITTLKETREGYFELVGNC